MGILSRFPRLKQTLKWGYYLSGAISSSQGAPFSLATGLRARTYGEGHPLFGGYFDVDLIAGEEQALLAQEIQTDGRLNILRISESARDVVASSETWNLQQGARAGWLPGHTQTLFYNSISDGVLRGHLRDLEAGGVTRTCSPIAAVSADGSLIGSTDYSAITRLNPEYGYPQSAENAASPVRQECHGALWVEDTASGDRLRSVDLSTILEQDPHPGFAEVEHEINHLSFSPGRQQLAFIHRWYHPSGQRQSRLLSLDLASGTLHTLLDEGMVSHYCWLDDIRLFLYGNSENGGAAFYTLSMAGHQVRLQDHPPLTQYGDGDPGLHPERDLLIFDSYPDWRRYQHLYLYAPERGTVRELGVFRSPLRFFGPRRCDLHPRWDQTGQRVLIDVCYSGQRDLMVLDLEEYLDQW